MGKDKVEKNKHPRKTANPFSIATFCWIIPVFIKGFKKVLEEEDLYEPLKEHEANFLGNKLENAWKNEKQKKHPSLWRALLRVFGLRILFLGFVSLFLEIFVKIAEPLALGKLLDFYTTKDTQVTRSEAYVYAGVISGSSILYVVISHLYAMENQHLGMQMRIAICSIIYRKSLKLSQVAFEKISAGQLVNLLSNDVDRFDSILLHIHSLWLCPMEIVIILLLMYFHLGFTATVGSVFLIMFLPIQIYLGKKISFYRLRTAMMTDERVRLMDEIISGINVIKMYSWEIFFTKLIKVIRRQEIDKILAASFIKGVTLAARMFATRISIYFCIMAYLMSGYEINATYVFVVTSYYSILRKTLILQFPCGIREFAEGITSVRRVQNFILLEEAESISKRSQDMHYDSFKKSISETDFKIILQNVTATWPSHTMKYTLTNINLVLKRNETVAIIGNVGSGKTSLLHIILKELKILEGLIDINGKISYASQEPWLFSGTIKENIIFGNSFNEKRYNEVVNVCSLERDFFSLPTGDHTFLGEKGVNLSGGQRARINLARAIYREADIYILDDPLSAVDTEVGNYIFQKCITQFLKSKCVILVTHQLQYLQNVEKIIVLDEGTIKYQGSYQCLKKDNTFCLTVGSEKCEENNSNLNETLESLPIPIQIDNAFKADELLSENKESKNIGKISLESYYTYVRSGGTLVIASLILFTFLITQASSSGADYFITYWVNMEQDRLSELRNGTVNRMLDFVDRNGLLILGITVTFNVVLGVSSTLLFYWFCSKASKSLHDKMISHTIYAKTVFFSMNPSGRILNRFSKDLGNIDEKLPDVLVDLIQLGLSILGTVIVIIIVNHWIVIVAGIVFVLFYLLRKVYLSTSLSIKRLEGVTRSPVYTHLNVSLQGLVTIRAFGAEDALKRYFDSYQNINSSATYLSIACTRAFGFWLDIICAIFITSVTFSFLLMKHVNYSANIGLAITQASGLTKMFQKCIRQWSELDNQMISVERITEYTKICTEVINKNLPPSTWPTEGSIELKSVYCRYSEKFPWILKGLNISINSKEKIGIVGRTGAGKSSLINALFQLNEISGQILIDGVDTQTIPLNYLRSKISIIPQDPVLFAGTIRRNLDPFGEYSDIIIWSVLEQVELKQIVVDLRFGLESRICEGGKNFSVGQRQLFCLARAMIRNNKILVLDEATANVDQQTDSLIQRTIRKRFTNCTVLTIAHRLHTVMDSDRILVLENGCVIEFDHPYILLRNELGALSKLITKTTPVVAENLRKMAEKAYMERKHR